VGYRSVSDAEVEVLIGLSDQQIRDELAFLVRAGNCLLRRTRPVNA
jgi:hypothetical protein